MDRKSTAASSHCDNTSAVLQRIWDVDFKAAVSSPNYPPISSIPKTGPERLERASPKPCPDGHISSSSSSAAPYLLDTTSSSATVLYLAYGSNLCAQTFLGQRGIRPLSAINVAAPSLRLTFDLAGIAYKEPCFANVAPRKVPKLPPKIPDVPDIPDIPDPRQPPRNQFPPSTQKHIGRNAHGDPVWDNGLIGVVYEVTAEDYAAIVKTEGGGASYQDILVPCIPITSKWVGEPEKPPVPQLPRPFLAHTLYAPQIQKKPGDGDEGEETAFRFGDGGDDDDSGDDDSPIDKIKDWWRRLLLQPIRPDPEYAQPSARYLKLITDGAAEHGLPTEYQAWLAQLQPYTITTRMQAIGQFLFVGIMAPMMLIYFGLGKLLVDKDGKVPAWLALVTAGFFHLVWMGYDVLFKPVFGDGERTEDKDEDGKKQSDFSRRTLLRKNHGTDEEKLGLLDEL